MLGHAVRMPVPMDQDLRQVGQNRGWVPAAGGFAAVSVVQKEVRTCPDQLRRHRQGKEEQGGRELLRGSHRSKCRASRPAASSYGSVPAGRSRRV